MSCSLSRLINCSVSSGAVPSKFKISEICLVFNNGDDHSFSNYRLNDINDRITMLKCVGHCVI